MHDNDYKIVFDTVYQEYQTFLLSRKDTAQILGLSLSSLDRLVLQENLSCRKIGNGNAKNKTVKFPLPQLVEYIINQKNETYL